MLSEWVSGIGQPDEKLIGSIHGDLVNNYMCYYYFGENRHEIRESFNELTS
jgi:hypothetical protein